MVSRLLSWLLVACHGVLLMACATHWEPPSQPQQGPAEPALPSNAQLWLDLEALRSEQWFHLLDTGEEGLTWRLRMIDSASQRIDIQSFIWKNDRVGALIMRRVLAAADRGVEVRILVDDSFLAGRDESLARVSQHRNVSYRIYNPLQRRAGSAFERQLANAGDFSRIDHRMHNKLLLVDGRVAIVGGRNMADEYFGYHRRHNFRDLEVLFGGDTARRMAPVFDSYWSNRWSTPLEELVEVDRVAVAVAVSPMVSWPDESEAARRAQWRNMVRRAASGSALIMLDAPPEDFDHGDRVGATLAGELYDALARAQHRVTLVTAYFVPTPELSEQLRELRGRGIAVTLLTNSLASNNHASAHSAYRKYRQAALADGIGLYELRADGAARERYVIAPELQSILGLHAKSFLVDERYVFIGSANLDPRSLRLNTEIGLLIDSPELNARLRLALAYDLTPANAWSVQLDDRGKLCWIAGAERLTSEPEASFYLSAESWLFGLLPIEGEM